MIKKDSMEKMLGVLITKRFTVEVGGEFERTTKFIGLMKLLANYSSFFNSTCEEKYSFMKKFIKNKEAIVDSNILVKYK